MKNKSLLFSVVTLLFFVVLSFFIFPQAFSGKEPYQPDIFNYKGGIEEIKQHRDKYKEESYWSNSMFGGMPTYQSGAVFENDWIKKIDQILRLKLPKPADYLFLCLFGFFILGLSFFKNWKYSLLGSIFFSFSTYFFIIIAAGHNSKLHSIAYFAPLVAGVLLLFRKNYAIGFLLFTLFFALELAANHPQMTYYLLLSLVIFYAFQFFYSLKNKEIKSFVIASALLVLGGMISIGMNANRLITTYELSKESIRGKPATIKTEKSINDKGLDKEYITQWSYGKLETLNLFIPHFTGGGDGEEIELKNTQQAIQDNISSQEEYDKYAPAFSQISNYWGDQPMTFGPAYQGAVVVFLALLALFFVNNRYKWWLFSATIFSILLAWGKNFALLTDFFIDYFPLYNKFRAVSSILVIAEFTLPFLAIMGVYHFFENKNLEDKTKKNILIGVTSFTVVLLSIFYVFATDLFSFQKETDSQLPSFLLNALVLDRLELFEADVLRTLVLVMLCAIPLFLYQFKAIKIKEIALVALGVLCFYDLYSVNKRYLNEAIFVEKRLNQNPFLTQYSETLIQKAEENKTVSQILSRVELNKELTKLKQIDSTQYRVLNLLISPFNESNTSYFHQSIGGYHGAKLRIYQDIIDTYFAKGLSENIINLLNTKYIVSADEQSRILSTINPNANGNAWFVQKIEKKKEGKDELLALERLNNKQEAIYVSDKPLAKESFSTGNSSIKLVDYKPNKLTYSVQTPTNQFAVFSEIYYPHGWKAYLDGKETPIIKTDFFLRGIEVPANAKKIVFEFKPQSVAYGMKISMVSSVLFLLLIIGGGFYEVKRRNYNTPKKT